MKTTKPLSTISYNSIGFLYSVLDRLVDNGILQFYAFIQHEPEEDENKAHCHVYIEPCKSVDTNWLRKQFLEPTTDGKQPLAVMPLQSSKWVDWYWYGLHDRNYLASKGMARKFHYDASSMLTNDIDYLMEKVRTNPCPATQLQKAMQMIEAGASMFEVASSMNTQVRYLKNTLEGLSLLKEYSKTIRNGRKAHEIADDNGVINDETD